MSTSFTFSSIADQRVFIPVADMTDSAPTGAGTPVLASVPQQNPSALQQLPGNAGQHKPPPLATQPVLISGHSGTQTSPTPHNGIQDVPSVSASSETSIGNSDDVAASLSEIGETLQSQGKLEQPLEHYLKALSVQDVPSVSASSETSIGNSNDVAASLSEIGETLQSQGKLEQALEHYLKALSIKENNIGTNPYSVAASCSQVGALLKVQGRGAEALVYFLRVLAIFEKSQGNDYAPTTAVVHEAVASLLHALGQHAQAVEHQIKALSIRAKIHSDHAEVGKVYTQIGFLLHEQGRHTEAMTYYVKALAITEKRLGINHIATATSYNNIGMLLKDQGKHAHALAYCLKALDIQEKVLGTNHADTAISYNNIGVLLQGASYLRKQSRRRPSGYR